MPKNIRRRAFLNQLGLGCAGIGATSLLSGITNMGLINSASAANVNRPLTTSLQDDYKALVCVFFGGGADSWNFLIPRGDAEYAEYAAQRGIHAIAQNDLLAINPNTSDGKSYGLHPNFPKIQQLFEDGNMAFVSNIGPLIQRSTQGNIIDAPRGLYSHNDQIEHWHTALYDQAGGTGWGGRVADILSSQNDNTSISMNISLSGINRFQGGSIVQPYTITNEGGGAVQLTGTGDNSVFETIKRQTLDSLIEQEYANILDRAYSNAFTNATGSGFEFASAINNIETFNVPFDTDKDLSNDLAMIAKTIGARNTLGFGRQVFFVSMGGFDMHTNAINRLADATTTIDDAFHSFYAALEQLGVQDQVTTYTMSDFGRRLSSNGAGTDHGWGGNHMIMGGAVKGKEIYGDFPELNLAAPQNVGNGRMIPSTSTDEYFAELALWFGVSTADLEHIFPTLSNFWTPSSGSPMGFLL